MKDSPSKVDQIGVKVRTANDAVQSIKQLRKEIVEIMSQLLCLAKSKNPKGMLPLCNEMITKTRSLLNIWEPSLVEEAFAFIEKHRIIDDVTDTTLPLKLSPFRNITQQLGALDLKSPDLEDFASPIGPAPNLWSHMRRNTTPCVNIPNNNKIDANNGNFDGTNTFKIYQDTEETMKTEQIKRDSFEEVKLDSAISENNNTTHQSLPPCSDGSVGEALVFTETHFDIDGEVLSLPMHNVHTTTSAPKADIISGFHPAKSIRASYDDDTRAMSLDFCGTFLPESQLNESKNEILLNSNEFDENGRVRHCSIALGQNGTFLDTKVGLNGWYMKEM